LHFTDLRRWINIILLDGFCKLREAFERKPAQIWLTMVMNILEEEWERFRVQIWHRHIFSIGRCNVQWESTSELAQVLAMGAKPMSIGWDENDVGA